MSDGETRPGLNGEQIRVGDRVFDTRPHGRHGTVVAFVNDVLVRLRADDWDRDFNIASRHLVPSRR